MKTKYLIIGSGIAGLSCAKQIRKEDKEGTLIIVSEESMAPYYRIKLTEAIASGASREELLVEKEDFYTQNNVELRLHTTVDHIDFDASKAILADGETIEYEKLLLAIGSHPFIPPYEGAGKANLFSMRTMEDLEQFRACLDGVKTVLVVGGGLLGLEAAYSVLQQGKEVHVCEFADHLLVRQLDEETSKRLKEELEAQGLIVHTGSTLKEAVGDGRVERVKLTGGEEFECQAVLFSVGVRSNTALVQEQLEVNRGIVVDASLKASKDNVWAAGDCAEIQGMTMGLWTAANEMGKIAGENMTGGQARYDMPKLFTSLRIGAVRLYSAGSHEGDDVWSREEGEDVVKLFFKEGTIIGGILYHDTKKMGMINQLLTKKASKEEAVAAFA